MKWSSRLDISRGHYTANAYAVAARPYADCTQTQTVGRKTWALQALRVCMGSLLLLLCFGPYRSLFLWCTFHAFCCRIIFSILPSCGGFFSAADSPIHSRFSVCVCIRLLLEATTTTTMCLIVVVASPPGLFWKHKEIGCIRLGALWANINSPLMLL